MAICLSATLRGAPIVQPAGEERSPLLLPPSLPLFLSFSRLRVFFAFHHRGINPGLEESLLLERGSNLSLSLSFSRARAQPPLAVVFLRAVSPRSFCPDPSPRLVDVASASSEVEFFSFSPDATRSPSKRWNNEDRDRMKLQLLRGGGADERPACIIPRCAQFRDTTYRVIKRCAM